MAYALGKFAKGLCDRCAFEYKLSELREEWNGAKVCPEALYRPRPNNDHEEGEGFVVVVQSNLFRPDYLNTSTLPTNFTVSEMTGNVGEVTIVT